MPSTGPGRGSSHTAAYWRARREASRHYRMGVADGIRAAEQGDGEIVAEALKLGHRDQPADEWDRALDQLLGDDPDGPALGT